MNIVEKKPAPPIPITEDIQVSLNRLGRDLETHAESGIRIGKELIYLKEITPHGTFGDLVEWAYSVTSRQCRNYMQVAEKFGNQNGNKFPFSNTVLIELSKPSTPESAREEALEHDKLTVKQSKELVQAHKEVEELKAENLRLKDGKRTPEPANTDNLIPEIKELLENGLIMPAMALNISTMDDKGQRAWLSMHVRKNSLENQLREKSQKVKDLESRPDPEPVKIIVEKMPEGVEQKIKDAEKKERQANKDLKMIAQLKNDKASVELTAKKLNDERNELERKIKALESSNQVKTPAMIDDSRYLKLARSINELDWIFPDILKEAELAGGDMPKSKGEITEIIRRWSSLLKKIDGQSVIDI